MATSNKIVYVRYNLKKTVTTWCAEDVTYIGGNAAC